MSLHLSFLELRFVVIWNHSCIYIRLWLDEIAILFNYLVLGNFQTSTIHQMCAQATFYPLTLPHDKCKAELEYEEKRRVNWHLTTSSHWLKITQNVSFCNSANEASCLFSNLFEFSRQNSSFLWHETFFGDLHTVWPCRSKKKLKDSFYAATAIQGEIKVCSNIFLSKNWPPKEQGWTRTKICPFMKSS